MRDTGIREFASSRGTREQETSAGISSFPELPYGVYGSQRRKDAVEKNATRFFAFSDQVVGWAGPFDGCHNEPVELLRGHLSNCSGTTS